MGAGIADTAGILVLVREIVALAGGFEGKLQYLHPGEAEALS